MPTHPSVVVVVDTNAMYDDVMQTRAQWMRLLSLSARGRIRLCIPTVALRETSRHWEERVTRAQADASSAHGKLVKSRRAYSYLGLKDLAEPPELPEVTISLEEFYNDRAGRLSSLGAEILPLPKVSTSEILERDLGRRKPFADKGKGFRDAVLWHSVKELLEALPQSSTLYFISNDLDDFWLEDSLHPDLAGEIAPLDRDFRVLKKLDDLLESEALRPLVAELAATDDELEEFLRQTLEAGELEEYEPISISDLVRSAVMTEVLNLVGEPISAGGEERSVGLDFSEIDIPPELESPTVSYVMADEASVDWETYETYEEETLLIRATVDADVEVEGAVFKPDYYVMGEEFSAIEDLNDHYLQATLNVAARLVFQLRVEAGVGLVEYTEFETAEPLFLPDADS